MRFQVRPTSPEQKAAANGARLLDREKVDWARKIDLRRLDISSTLECPLGQVYGSYFTGWQELDLLTADEREAHGFVAGPQHFPALNRAWRKEIRARQGGWRSWLP